MPGKYRGILVSRKPQDYKKPALESALRTVLFKKLEARAPRLRMLKKKGLAWMASATDWPHILFKRVHLQVQDRKDR